MANLMAVEKLKYFKPSPLVVIHSNVIVLNPEITEKMRGYREYKCMDCGKTWREEINSPIIISQSDISTYYSHAKRCDSIESK